jgi:hypothetical protein
VAALYILAEGGGASWQVWPVPDSIPSGAVREGGSYLFELYDCEAAQGADLLIDGIPIEALRARDPRGARWRWEPGFHAGVVEAHLRIPGIGVRRFEVTTDPDLRKLTREHFDVMVREVLQDTFALFSLSAFRKGVARQPGNRPPPIARLEFLRSRADAIVGTVEAIIRAPRHILRPEGVTVPVHRAARATGPEIIKSFRTGVIRTETVWPSRLPPALGGRLPAQISLRLRRNSADIPEHRQIKACLESWAAWLSGAADALLKIGGSDDPGIVTTAAAWAVRARQIARRFSVAARTGFMADVGESAPVIRMSSLFRNDPSYRRFYRLWQEMNLGLAGVFGDFLNMPLARTHELYELWCFLRLLRAAIEEFGAAGVDMSQLFTGDAAGSVTIAAGAVIVPIGTGQALCFQRRYREYWVEPDGEGSFSRDMIPDIVYADSGATGKGRRMIVLDAKYRIESGLNDALSSIHAYRDALVHEDVKGSLAGVVKAAYLLAPSLPSIETAKGYRSNPMPGRLFHPEYRDTFRFGAIVLAPGMSLDDIRGALRIALNDAAASRRTA